MPGPSAPGAIRRATTAAAVQRTGANLSPASICGPPAPAGNRRAPSCASRIVTPKLARRRSPASPGADRPPTCSMLPPTELAFSGIDLDAVPLPRIEEISGRGTFTRPMPEQAAVLGQRGRQVLRPTAATPSAVPRPPGHTPPPTLIGYDCGGLGRSHWGDAAGCARARLAVICAGRGVRWRQIVAQLPQSDGLVYPGWPDRTVRRGHVWPVLRVPGRG
jgi:hypothetical protein